MPRYRTEVVVAADRYVCLQLPLHFPQGAAVVTVFVAETGDAGRTDLTLGRETDRDDIEWWDEFGELDPGA